MKYIITDPCYIHPKETWQDFVDMFYKDGLPEGGYKMNGIGKMIECLNTNNGDGMVTVTNYKGEKRFIGVDSGLVCIVQVGNNFKEPKDKFGVITNNLDEAIEFYEKALQI